MRVLCIIICLVIAIGYYFVWPGWTDAKGTQRHRSVFSKFVLRWFHSVTWVLFAVACFLQAKLPAALAAVMYLIFVVTLMHERRSGRRI